jgi:hypothetical protein
VIPPEANADFVCAMEDVLEVYQRPYDPKRPVVCVDEATKQLVKETRQIIPAAPGRPERVDYEYERNQWLNVLNAWFVFRRRRFDEPIRAITLCVRNGTSNLFMICEPLAGRRRVKVTDRRTKIDFAHVLREIVDEDYSGAEVIVLVMDNLNTHKPASLYEAFEPSEARRILNRLEIHYTPKHGSWLDMAEIELNVLQKQCLDRRIPDQPTLIGEVAVWEQSRNNANSKVNWQFTTEDARIKLKRLYPSIQAN